MHMRGRHNETAPRADVRCRGAKQSCCSLLQLSHMFSSFPPRHISSASEEKHAAPSACTPPPQPDPPRTHIAPRILASTPRRRHGHVRQTQHRWGTPQVVPAPASSKKSGLPAYVAAQERRTVYKQPRQLCRNTIGHTRVCLEEVFHQVQDLVSYLQAKTSGKNVTVVVLHHL